MGRLEFTTQEAEDGTLRVSIPSIEAVTWATSPEDAERAVNEAVELYKMNVRRFGTTEDKRFMKSVLG